MRLADRDAVATPNNVRFPVVFNVTVRRTNVRNRSPPSLTGRFFTAFHREKRFFHAFPRTGMLLAISGVWI